MAAAAPFAIMGGLQAAGGIFQAASALSSGNAASATVLQAARLNSAFAQQQASMQREMGEVAYMRGVRQGKILKGRTLAGLAAAGVDVSAGSPLDMLAQQTKESEYAAEVQRFAFQERAWEITQQDALNVWQADTQAAGIRRDATGKAIGAVIGGLTGAASAFAWQSASAGSTPTQTPAQQLAAGTRPV
jgi:hypothetical protein